MPYDLLLGIPVHCAPAVVADSGLCVDSRIPVDPLTFETAVPDVYAIGDVTSVGTPKAGVFSEGQAVVADAIIARHRGAPVTTTYDGHGICYVEFGADQVAGIDVTFRSGEPPTGVLDGPSSEFATDSPSSARAASVAGSIGSGAERRLGPGGAPPAAPASHERQPTTEHQQREAEASQGARQPRPGECQGRTLKAGAT